MRNENSATASVATTSVNTKKLALAAVFAAIAVVGSTFSVPVFGSKCAPVQHLVNVLCAVFLGPAYGVAAAFIASVIRNLMGLGSLLAFPGSMCGAFLSGYLYKKLRKLPAAYVGILSYPIAAFIMGNTKAAVFTFVVPFLVSTCGGTLIAVIITVALRQTGFLERAKEMLK